MTPIARRRGAFLQSRAAVVAVASAITLLTVLARCGASAIAVALDLVSALVVMLPGIALGFLLLPRRWALTLPLRWQILISAAMGLGTTSFLVLIAGCAGWLHRGLSFALLAAGLMGAVRFLRIRREHIPLDRSTHQSPSTRAAWGWRWFWLLAAVPLGLSLTAASTAPGVLWSEEGFGYDALEYHLQMPREYFDAGQIRYAPHNVYANFPANVETLYLLAMIVHNDAVDSGTIAQMIHLLLGVLAVYAIWVAGTEAFSAGAHVAGVVAATAGWFPYLAGLAYVENGLLFFGATAIAALLRAIRPEGEFTQAPRCEPRGVEHSRASSSEPRASARADFGTSTDVPARLECETENRGVSHRSSPWDSAHSVPPSQGGTNGGPGDRPPWYLLCGLMAGFACGCKYTGVALFALPLLLAAAGRRAARAHRARRVLAMFVGSAVGFSPWLVKNAVMTGNPVFPLANGIFRASPPGWGEAQTLQWDRAHAPSRSELAEIDSGSSRRISAGGGAVWRRIVADPEQRFGPAMFVLALVGLASRKRGPEERVLLFLAALQLLVWLFFTHWFARFAVVLIVPLSLLAGRSLGEAASAARSAIVASALIAGALWNTSFAVSLHRRECPGPIAPSAFSDGRIPGYEHYGFVNHDLPHDAKLLLVGESRPFYFLRPVDYSVVFNRNPFAEAVSEAKRDADIVDWLRSKGYTHVLVHWSEVRRLSATYGFPATITPELFDRLLRSGLTHVPSFTLPGQSSPFVDVYSVPR